MSQVQRDTTRACPEPAAVLAWNRQAFWGDKTVSQRPGANWSALLPLCGLLALAATVGCSAKVQVESENWDTASQASTGERARTAVEVDLLRSQPAVPNPPEPKPNTVIINVDGGSVYVHQSPSPADSTRPKKTTLNTKIGWPNAYSEYGTSAFLGSIAVWVLLGIAVALMVENCGRSEGGPLFSTIGLLVLAAILLQALPQPSRGFNSFPCHRGPTRASWRSASRSCAGWVFWSPLWS